MVEHLKKTWKKCLICELNKYQLEQEWKKLIWKITTKNVGVFNDDSEIRAEMEAILSDEEKQVRFEQ